MHIAVRRYQKYKIPAAVIIKKYYFCIELLNRGALTKRAEIKPIEPDAGNAVEGMDKL